MIIFGVIDHSVTHFFTTEWSVTAGNILQEHNRILQLGVADQSVTLNFYIANWSVQQIK